VTVTKKEKKRGRETEKKRGKKRKRKKWKGKRKGKGIFQQNEDTHVADYKGVRLRTMRFRTGKDLGSSGSSEAEVRLGREMHSLPCTCSLFQPY